MYLPADSEGDYCRNSALDDPPITPAGAVSHEHGDSEPHSYQNKGISGAVMDEVEADEIISASEGFGNRGTNSSQSEKQHIRPRQRTSSPERMLSKKLILLNVLTNFLMFAIAGFITYHCFNKATVLFSWHPTFMSIGVRKRL